MTVKMRYKLPDYIIVTRRKLHYYSAFSVSIMRFFYPHFYPVLSLSLCSAKFFVSMCECVRAMNAKPILMVRNFFNAVE